MNRLAVYGASGHGKVVAEIAELNGWREIVFFDQAVGDIQQNGCWLVEGDFEDLLTHKFDFDAVIVAIGNNQVRTDKSELLRASGVELATLIHPSAIVSPHSSVGTGTVIMAMAVVNPFVAIGNDVIINSGAIVEHDCSIGNGVHICPGVSLAGEVIIGEKSWIGIGASVIQQCQIGDASVIGAGSVVIDNIPSHVTACGVPAKLMKSI